MRYTVEAQWDSSAAFTAEETYDRLIALGANEPSPGFLRDVINTLYEFGVMPEVSLNADLMTAHCANETGKENVGTPFNSEIYLTRGVIDGLGVTDGEDQGLSFTSGRNAALAHLVHLFAYVHGAITKRHPLYGYILFDPRYQLVLNGGHAGKVTTVKSMTGWWWTDSTGHTSVIKQANAIYNEFTSPVDSPPEVIPVSITYGRVPHPSYLDRPIRKADGQGVGYYGQRSVKGVVLHRMIGSLWGTDEYFQTAAALTDYGVGVVAQDGAANDGVIVRWNDPLGDQSGWASGKYSSAAYGDGAAFVAKYATGSVGLDAINRDQASIEISGISYDTAFSEKAKNAVASLMAYWADQYRIPWDVFPIAPQDGFSFVRWHQEFGPDNGTKKCPGSVVMNATDDLIERARAIMKRYQETAVPTTPPPPPKPTSPYPPGMSAALAKRLYGSVAVSWAEKPFAFDIKRSECKAWLERGKKSMTGKTYDTGTWPEISDVVRRGDGSRLYTYSDGSTFAQGANGGMG